MTNHSYKDEYEKSLEDNFENLKSIKNIKSEISKLVGAAKKHVKKKKSITIRVQETDLLAMQLKAQRLGIPYQTYINMLIHSDAKKGIKDEFSL